MHTPPHDVGEAHPRGHRGRPGPERVRPFVDSRVPAWPAARHIPSDRGGNEGKRRKDRFMTRSTRAAGHVHAVAPREDHGEGGFSATPIQSRGLAHREPQSPGPGRRAAPPARSGVTLLTPRSRSGCPCPCSPASARHSCRARPRPDGALVRGGPQLADACYRPRRRGDHGAPGSLRPPGIRSETFISLRDKPVV